MKKMKFTIIGLNIIYYVDDVVYGHNCDFTTEPEELEKYALYLKDENKEYWKLELWVEYGECGSGWTTASWGFANFYKIKHLEPFGYKPKGEFYFELNRDENGDYDIYELEMDDYYMGDELFVANVFQFSGDGGDSYYPMGGVSVNVDMFEKLERAMEQRPVWIFKGASGLGKSTLASACYKGDKTIFETDSVSELPEFITEDIVVLGNKNGFTLDDVIKHLFGNPKPIIVNFEEASI